MKIRCIMITVLVLFVISCTIPVTPQLSLDNRDVYTSSDIVMNYTYVCEEESQRCVINLYSYSAPSVSLYSRDEVMPQTGSLDFSDLGLGEGDYRIEFSVYSERDGEYSLLKFLDKSWDFTIDFP